MAASLTIGTTTYPSIAIIEDQYDQTDNLQERGGLQCDIIDYVGVHFQRGEQVIVTDPVLGTIFSGFVDTDKERPLYPSGYIYHTINCMGMHYLADKRTYTATYSTSALAGKIAVDILSNVLTIEGIVQNFAVRNDNDVTTWSEGNLSNVVATTNLTTVPGDLELAEAGTDLTITPDLSAGTATNMTWTGAVLEPTLISGIKFVSQITAQTTNISSAIYATIWTGSITVTSNMTFSITVWVPSTNKDIVATIDMVFSDSSRMNTLSPSIYDQNNYASYTLLGNTINDLSIYAKDQWYQRNFTFPSAYTGKVISRVDIGMGGSASGLYTAFYKNITVGGTTIFGTAATAFQTTPYVSKVFNNFLSNQTAAGIFNVFDPANASWVSSSTNLAALDILRSSVIQFYGSNTNLFNVYVSYDGNVYLQCTNNKPLPVLPGGSVTVGSNATFKIIPFAGSSSLTIGSANQTVSADPSVIPTISEIIVQLLSSYNPIVAKSDITTSFGTTAQWNTGSYTNTTASGTDLTLGNYNPSWTGSFPSGYTIYWGWNGSSVTVTQSISSGTYIQSYPSTGSNANTEWAITQINAISNLQDVTIQVSLKIPATNDEIGVVYRNNGWNGAVNNSFGYFVGAYNTSGSSGSLVFGYGSNSNTGSDSFTQLSLVGITASVGTTYPLKIVVQGSNHNIYWNGATTPTISIIDSTYVYPGGVGFRGFGQNAAWNNVYSSFTVTPIPSGTWTSPSVSLDALATCGGSSIGWVEVNTNVQTDSSTSTSGSTTSSITVQASFDGGSTYTQCTNNSQIPTLSDGASLTGRSIIIQAILNTISQPYTPILRGLTFRVLGKYPGSSGIRTTAPLGTDMSITRTVGSGWGTSFDNQTWTQIGTGTTQVSSNTETIANTTGDVNMQFGSRTWTDQDCTIRFKLSASTIEAGITLRYVSSTSYYRLFATTTALTIIKNDGGSILTMNTVPISLTTNTQYYMRFRVVGSTTVELFGNVWLNNTLEPTINSSNGLWNDNNWIILTGE